MGKLIMLVVAAVAFFIGVSLSTGSPGPDGVSTQAAQGPMLYIAAAAAIAIGFYMFKTMSSNGAANTVALAFMLSGAGVFLGPLIFGPPSPAPSTPPSKGAFYPADTSQGPVASDRPLTAPAPSPVPPPPAYQVQPAPPPAPQGEANWSVDLPPTR
jgi:hypothetical protein